ncbi:MAG: hypothetical protein KBA57_06495 [Sphingomonadaceae bacterium]|nr:hypothetical protein [Sphingomonadaceae bacterium]
MTSLTISRLDGLVGSVANKAPCLLKTTANHALSGLAAIDGVTPTSGARILVGSQTTTSENGIYVASSGAWSRALDFDGTYDATGGTHIFVIQGTASAATYWKVDGTAAIDIGTDAITFSEANVGTPAPSGVTSVDVSGGSTGLNFTGGPITGSGTITLSGTLDLDNGGSGATTAAGARAAFGAAASGANTDITALDQDVTVTETGTIAANSLGFRGLPSSSQSQGSLITLALSDASKRVKNTTGGWAIPANGTVAFPIGTIIVLHNDSASTQTVSITTDTLTLQGTTTTGTRTLLANGMAYLMKDTATKWLIDGNVS